MTNADLKEIIKADSKANNFQRLPLKILNIRYRYLYLLRKCERYPPPIN